METLSLAEANWLLYAEALTDALSLIDASRLNLVLSLAE
jgi:hypothetical protein